MSYIVKEISIKFLYENFLIYVDLKIIYLIKKSVKTVENYYQKVLTGIIKLAIIIIDFD